MSAPCSSPTELQLNKHLVHRVLELEHENTSLKSQLQTMLHTEVSPYFLERFQHELDPLALKILSFWFGKDYDGHSVSPEKYMLWFGKSEATDLEIDLAYKGQLDNVVNGLYDHWNEHPYGTLALVILMDQFPRNIFRNNARSFAYDWKACLLAREGIFQRQCDNEMSPIERVWLYLVFTHAEDLKSQQECVNFGKTKLDGMEKVFKQMWQMIFEKHLVVIEKFGRFPHRNKFLKRPGTPEEEEFVNDPKFRFDLPVKLNIDPQTGKAAFTFIKEKEEDKDDDEKGNPTRDEVSREVGDGEDFSGMVIETSMKKLGTAMNVARCGKMWRRSTLIKKNLEHSSSISGDVDDMAL